MLPAVTQVLRAPAGNEQSRVPLASLERTCRKKRQGWLEGFAFGARSQITGLHGL